MFLFTVSFWHLKIVSVLLELRALRGYFAPMRPKLAFLASCFSLVSSYKYIRTLYKVQKSGIDSTFIVALLTKLAAKIT